MTTSSCEAPKAKLKKAIVPIFLGIIVPLVLALIMNQAIAQVINENALLAQSITVADNTVKPLSIPQANQPVATQPDIYGILISNEADTDGYVTQNKASLPSASPHIYVTVQITHAHPGIRVMAKIENEETKVSNSAMNVTTKTGNIMKAFTFNITNNKSWPRGSYKVSVSLSSGGSKTVTFTIQ